MKVKPRKTGRNHNPIPADCFNATRIMTILMVKKTAVIIILMKRINLSARVYCRIAFSGVILTVKLKV